MMFESRVNLHKQRTARILTAACGLLFSAFSIVYLYLFQKDLLEAMHYTLAQGKTEYSPLGTALVITLVLLLMRWGVNALLGLKGIVRELSYFPSFLVLGVITDVDYSIYQEGFSDKWMWLLPLLLIVYFVGMFMLRRLFRSLLDVASDGGRIVTCNLTIFLLLCFMTTGIGNTNIHFHHGLAVESALRRASYSEARQVGYLVMDPSRSLTALRAYAMSKEGTLGEHLFEYPQYYGAEGLLIDADEVLRVTPDSLYTYLGDRPHEGESAMRFFQRICNEETGNHTTLEYYLSALLLEKQLGKFYESFHTLYTPGDNLPHYYKEALFLYEKLHPDVEPTLQDETLEQDWSRYQASKEELAGSIGEGNFMRRIHGNTYWWYYQY